MTLLNVRTGTFRTGAEWGAKWGAFCAAMCAAPLVFAQPEAAAPGPAPHPNAQWLGGPMRHDNFFAAASELGRERIVKDAPYCADALREHVQALADGNRIVQRTQMRLCRDSQGRTRQEVSLGGHRKVYVNDPVAQESWLLEPDAKTAVRLDGMRSPHGIPMDHGAMERLRDWAHEMREWGRRMGEHLRAQFAEGREPERQADAASAASAQQDSAARPPQPVRILIGGVRLAEMPPPPPAGAMPAMIAFQARLHAPRGPGSTTALPPDTIEGLRAEGRRTTWTIEAGRIGNEKPIQLVREVWTSPELLVTLRSRDSDPLAGEDQYRLQHVARAEPDAALFRVPADYRKEMPSWPMPRGRHP
jgi:hypothetical protein